MRLYATLLFLFFLLCAYGVLLARQAPDRCTQLEAIYQAVDTYLAAQGPTPPSAIKSGKQYQELEEAYERVREAK